MKSAVTVLVLRALIVRGGPAMALLGLVACATTPTTPVSRQADPVFARKGREMFSLKSNQMVEKSVCIGLRASCRVYARPAKWRA
jgi:hypothetical protein